ncbi:MAG: hydroxypyruvate isomerase [Rubrivivax sp.]|nr:hydroxypyruvate isomerase [Rubrivivax sp.]
MPYRFSANLSMLFTEVPLLDRFERAARAGFSRVEIQFPYEVPAAEIAARLKGLRLTMVLHNLPAGDWAAGERGIACHPGRTEEFRAGVQRAIDYAKVLEVPRLNVLAGIAPAGVDEAILRRTMVENLRHAADATQAVGIQLLTEPVNTRDIPGFWLDSTSKALSVMDEVGSDNLLLQYDVYHAQRTEGELAATLSRHLARIGHIQIADNPGRNEPGTGEINFPFLLRHIKQIGYTGSIGAEYKPAKGTEAGLGWMDMAVRAFS